MAEELRIGVDLGGTKIEAIAFDGQGKELARPRIETPRSDYDASLLRFATWCWRGPSLNHHRLDHRADFFQQGVHGEGLAEHLHAHIHQPIANGSIFSVAGDEQNTQARA